MKLTIVRGTIAILLIAVFLLITAFMALYPLLSNTGVELTTYADYFVKIASIYTGILGVVIGFYFGRAYEKKKPKGKNS